MPNQGAMGFVAAILTFKDGMYFARALCRFVWNPAFPFCLRSDKGIFRQMCELEQAQVGDGVKILAGAKFARSAPARVKLDVASVMQLLDVYPRSATSC